MSLFKSNPAKATKLTDELSKVPPPSAPPTREDIQIPPDNLPCFLLHNLLSKEECDWLIEQTEKIGYTSLESEYHPSYRNNDRVMVEDASLVEFVWNRIKDHVPAKVENSTTTNRNWQGTWEVIGLNERFRFCRYFHGGHFGAHRDAVFRRSNSERSIYTFMIYLSGGLVGGTTNFLDDKTNQVIRKVAPEAGMAIVFDHRLFHEGEELKGNGKKYLMRSDVMYMI